MTTANEIVHTSPDPGQATEADLPCAICGATLPTTGPGIGLASQPSGAQTFASHGHYGATCFDEMDGSHLSINICADCIHDLTASGRVLLVSRDGKRREPWPHGAEEHGGPETERPAPVP